jgi:hypothetical protein
MPPVRLAVCLAASDVESAVQRMREGLLGSSTITAFHPFHETLTRAWILAVRHFMDRGPSSSVADFVEKNPALLDSKIMLTHYSAGLLFSPDARAAFVEPDLDPIPRSPEGGGEPRPD